MPLLVISGYTARQSGDQWYRIPKEHHSLYMWPTNTVDESQDEDTPDHGW